MASLASTGSGHLVNTLISTKVMHITSLVLLTKLLKQVLIYLYKLTYLVLGWLLVTLLTDDHVFQSRISPLLHRFSGFDHSNLLLWWLHTLSSPHTPPWMKRMKHQQ